MIILTSYAGSRWMTRIITQTVSSLLQASLISDGSPSHAASDYSLLHQPAKSSEKERLSHRLIQQSNTLYLIT